MTVGLFKATEKLGKNILPVMLKSSGEYRILAAISCIQGRCFYWDKLFFGCRAFLLNTLEIFNSMYEN